jgi:endonuclease/exonuclease/phosphatase family metal-dependent hydrolase
VHAQCEEKSDDSKSSFYGELEQVFDHFHKYNVTVLLGDFLCKTGEREYFQNDNSEWESTSG